MHTYRVYGLSKSGVREVGRDIECADDTAAFEWAATMNGDHLTCEIWRGFCLIGTTFPREEPCSKRKRFELPQRVIKALASAT